MKIGVVGSSGVLGGILHEALTLSGHNVICYTRQGQNESHCFDVLVDKPPFNLNQLDAVVYLSWATTNRSPKMQLAHAEAAGRWANYCKTIGVKFLFISTVLARKSSISLYGRFKYEAEKLVETHTGKSARVGLVADDACPLLLTKIRKSQHAHRWLSFLIDWPIYAVSATTMAVSIIKILMEWPSESCFWIAPSRPTSLAVICATNQDKVKRCAWFNSIGKLIAHVPLKWAPIDAWRGMVTCSFDNFRLQDCQEIGISNLDWMNNLDPNRMKYS